MPKGMVVMFLFIFHIFFVPVFSIQPPARAQGAFPETWSRLDGNMGAVRDRWFSDLLQLEGKGHAAGKDGIGELTSKYLGWNVKIGSLRVVNPIPVHMLGSVAASSGRRSASVQNSCFSAGNPGIIVQGGPPVSAAGHYGVLKSCEARGSSRPCKSQHSLPEGTGTIRQRAESRRLCHASV